MPLVKYGYFYGHSLYGNNITHTDYGHENTHKNTYIAYGHSIAHIVGHGFMGIKMALPSMGIIMPIMIPLPRIPRYRLTISCLLSYLPKQIITESPFILWYFQQSVGYQWFQLTPIPSRKMTNREIQPITAKQETRAFERNFEHSTNYTAQNSSPLPLLFP